MSLTCGGDVVGFACLVFDRGAVAEGGGSAPFARAMLRDVRDPELVRTRPRELPVHEIIGRDDASKTFGPDRAGEPVNRLFGHSVGVRV